MMNPARSMWGWTAPSPARFPIGLERSAAVASEERHCRHLRLIEPCLRLRDLHHHVRRSQYRHRCPPLAHGRTSEHLTSSRRSGAGGSGPLCFVVRFPYVEVLASALKHGVLVEDIEHAVNNAMVIDDLDDDLRLYLGPDRSAALLEVITLVRDDDEPELVIHAMSMREKYRRLLPGGE